MKLFLALIALVSIASSHPIGKEPVNKKDVKALITKIEGPDGDGKLTLKEIETFFAKELEDGTISQEEFTAKLSGIDANLIEVLYHELDDDHLDGISKDELKKNIQEIDIDGNGEVTAKELTKSLLLGQIFEEIAGDDHKMTLDELKTAFGFDEKTTEIKKKDLVKHLQEKFPKYPKKVLKKLVKEFNDDEDEKITVQEVADNFNGFDANEDTKVTVEEFRQAILFGAIGQIFHKIDTDNDEEITEKELVDFFFKEGNDKNKDNGLDIDEFKAVLKGFPEEAIEKLFDELNDDSKHLQGVVTKEELTANFKAFDSNNNGKVDIREFYYSIKKGAFGQMFRKFDKNGNGKVTVEEMKAYLEEFDSEDNKDNKIDVDEFKKAFDGVPVMKVEHVFKKLAGKDDEKDKIDLETELPLVFAEIDKDHDKNITFSEFKKWVREEDNASSSSSSSSSSSEGN